MVTAEVRRADAPVGPQALLNFIADVQREASRVPFRLTRLSDAEEIRVGDNLAQEATGELGNGQGEVAAYIQEVGAKVAARAGRKLPYRFHYIPRGEFVNAFAIPGGHIFVGQGLLKQMTSEDQLASVLGHEIEHVDLYHCAERLQVEAHTRNIPLGGLVQLPIELFRAGYSKTQEFEADREGTWLAVRAGYSPYGAVRMFEKFEELRRTQIERAGTPQKELSNVALEILRGYFRSHPLPAERIEQIRKLIAQQGWEKQTTEKPLKTK